MKGTQFEDGQAPVQNVRQEVRREPNIASSHEFPPLRPVWNQAHNQQSHNTAQRNTPPNNTDFKCDYCPAIFKYKTELKNHMEKQHGVTKTFKCDECPSEYEYKNELRDHMEKQHTKTFKCDECPSEYEYKNELRDHMNRNHCNTDIEKEAYFLGMVQKSLQKVLPKALEMCLSGMIQQEPQNPQNGGNNSQMRWKLVPVNLN